MKTVLIGEEINFSVRVGFFDFSIRIQRYKERKFLGGALKVMIVSSPKGHGRCPVIAKLCVHCFRRQFSHFSSANFEMFSK